MYHHYFLINLLNFPHNIEEILHELQENADFLEKQTIGEWLTLLSSRKFWSEAELQKHLMVSDAQFIEMKTSQELPSDVEKQQFKNLLNQ